jgi:microcystin-dependent protein
MAYNYASIAEQVNRADDAERMLSASSLVLCLCALQSMENKWQWAGIDDDDFDVIDNWVSTAYRDLLTEIEESEAAMEIGSIFVWPNSGATIPENCLPCDGTEYLKSAYPDLYTALGSSWESDSTHFTVPDLRERVVIGKGGAFGFQDTGGEIEHTLTIAEMPAHGHTAGGKISAGNGLWFARADDNPGTTNPTNETGGDEPHNNMPPYMALVWVIVAE